MYYQHIVLNAATFGKNTRMELHMGRQHIVAPVVMMREGILNGSNGPFFYPAEELAKTPASWNLKPITLRHPDGDTATTPAEIAKRMLGVLQNTRWENGKLRAEAWFDVERLEDMAPEVSKALLMNEVMEVSTGVFTDGYHEPGEWNGEKYEWVARNYRPDHLAILPDQTGAFCVADGAGLLQLNKEDEAMEETPLLVPVMNFGEGCGGADGHGAGKHLPLPTMTFE